MTISGRPYEVPDGTDKDAFIVACPAMDGRQHRLSEMKWQPMKSSAQHDGEAVRYTVEDFPGYLKWWANNLPSIDSADSRTRLAIEQKEDIALIAFDRETMLEAMRSIPDGRVVLAVPVRREGSWSDSSGFAAIGTGSKGSVVMLAMLTPYGVLTGDLEGGRSVPIRTKKQSDEAAKNVLGEMHWARRVVDHIIRLASAAVKG